MTLNRLTPNCGAIALCCLTLGLLGCNSQAPEPPETAAPVVPAPAPPVPSAAPPTTTAPTTPTTPLPDATAANPAPRLNDARGTVGSLLRAQQAYYIENGSFASDIDTLGVAIDSETSRYSITIGSNSPSQAHVTATAKMEGLPSLTGAVFATSDSTQSILCQTAQPSTVPPSVPIFTNATTACPPGSVKP
ncbi:MAG: type IV pilin-like G/H family protein [Spirulinaceae cyanobacterium]